MRHRNRFPGGIMSGFRIWRFQRYPTDNTCCGSPTYSCHRSETVYIPFGRWVLRLRARIYTPRFVENTCASHVKTEAKYDGDTSPEANAASVFLTRQMYARNEMYGIKCNVYKWHKHTINNSRRIILRGRVSKIKTMWCKSGFFEKSRFRLQIQIVDVDTHNKLIKQITCHLDRDSRT